MELSNGVSLIRVVSSDHIVGLLIKSEIDDRQIAISGKPSHMLELIDVITKRLKKGFSFDVLRDYAQYTMEMINTGR